MTAAQPNKKSLFRRVFGGKNEIDTLNGPVTGKIFLYTVPIILTSVLQLLFNTCDMVVVAHYDGKEAVGAIGSTGALASMLVSMFMGLSVGASVYVAQYFGAKDEKNLSQTVHTSMVLGVIMGIVVSVIGFFASRPLLQLMNANETLIDRSTLYLKIYFLGMLPNMVYNFGAAILRSIGDTRNPLIFLTIAGFSNAVMNIIFSQFMPNLFGGYIGCVAWATVLSQLLAAVLVVWYLCRKATGAYKLEFKKLRIHRDKLLKILRVGLPAGVQGSIFSLSNMFIQTAVNRFDGNIISGNSSAAQLEGYIYVSMNSYYQSAVTFVGQNVGAKKFYRIKKIALSTLFLVTVTGLVVGLTCLIFGRPLLEALFLQKPKLGNFRTGVSWKIAVENWAESLEYALSRMRVIASIYFLCGIMDVLTGVLRGMGASITPTVITLLGACGSRVLWIYLIWPNFPKMAELFGSSLAWLYVSYPVSWGITIIAQLIYALILYRAVRRRYVKGHWKGSIGAYIMQPLKSGTVNLT